MSAARTPGVRPRSASTPPSDPPAGSGRRRPAAPGKLLLHKRCFQWPGQRSAPTTAPSYGSPVHRTSRPAEPARRRRPVTCPAPGTAGRPAEPRSAGFEHHRARGRARRDEHGLPETLRVEKVNLPVESQSAAVGPGLTERKYVLQRRGVLASAAQRNPAARISPTSKAEVDYLLERLATKDPRGTRHRRLPLTSTKNPSNGWLQPNNSAWVLRDCGLSLAGPSMFPRGGGWPFLRPRSRRERRHNETESAKS
jgi:hypothetical protein